jgi:hypothetical protein
MKCMQFNPIPEPNLEYLREKNADKVRVSGSYTVSGLSNIVSPNSVSAGVQQLLQRDELVLTNQMKMRQPSSPVQRIGSDELAGVLEASVDLM